MFLKHHIIFLVFISIPNTSFAQQTMGLFFNDEQAANGYTLFSNNETTYLIDNCGFTVNRWESEYKCDNGLYITPDGQLLRQGRLSGSFNGGGAGGILELYNWNGSITWSYQIADEQKHAHHDIELLPNGNILVIVWVKISETQASNLGRSAQGELWDEQIWELKPQGSNQADLVWRWSAIEHTIQDYNSTKQNFGDIGEHSELIDINYNDLDIPISPDWLHINSIDYNESYDQIAISSRNTSEVYVIDHSTTTQEAAGHNGGKYNMGGDILYRYGNPSVYDHGNESDRKLGQPHDVNWISGGGYNHDFSIFNNLYTSNNRSRIQLWKNPTDDGNYQFTEENLYGPDPILWEYTSPGFYSERMSSAQFLSNGNVLTVEGVSGEISEFTPSKEKVWKYINPVNKNGGPGIQGGTPHFNSLFRVAKYPTDYVGFDNYFLSPQSLIELSPYETDCNIYITNTHEIDIISNFHQNDHTLYFHNESSQQISLIMIDINGQKVLESTAKTGKNEISISSLSAGVYCIHFPKEMVSYTFVKS